MSERDTGAQALFDKLRAAYPDATLTPGPADPLAAALLTIARHFGISGDALTVSAGLPLDRGRLPLAQAGEAAARLGLCVIEERGDPRALAPAQCPAIATSPDGDAWIVAGVPKPGTLSIRPSTGDGKTFDVAASELKARGVHILSLRPVAAEVAEAADAATRLLSPQVVIANRALYGQAIIATLALNLIALAVPLFTMNVYDRVLPNNAQSTLWALGVGAIVAVVFEFILRTLRGSLIDVASRRADLVLSMRVYGRVLGAKLLPQAASVGSQANTLREIETIREFSTSVTLAALGDLPFALVFLGMIAVIGGPLVFVPLIAVPVILAAVLLLQLPQEKLHATTFRQMAQKSSVLVETLTGLETIKAAGAESWAAGKWERAVADHLRLSTAMRLLGGLGMSIVGLGTALTTIVMVMIGVGLVAQGAVTAGALMASMMLLGRAMGPVSQVAALAGRLHSVKLARSALQSVMTTPQERPVATAMIARSQLKGSILLEDVTFKYAEDAAPALQSVNLRIEPGERIAVLGVIGSGKSTLLKLLAKLYEPQSGRILIDGLALSGLDPYALRHRLGYLAQDSLLFRGNVRENIVMHRPLASDDTLMAAAEDSGALAWISRLPQGFDTALGERGAGLSGGQKRSLCLARALLGAPPVLLLDEPTSEMDGRTEQAILERLSRVAQSRTLVLVTHKHTLLPIVDRLIVLDRGRVYLDGPKAEVLQKLEAQSKPARRVNVTPTVKPA
ncbi:MAG: type I secretion system permease/ATPase [Hyphomicrobiaceae bacterium]